MVKMIKYIYFTIKINNALGEVLVKTAYISTGDVSDYISWHTRR